LNAYNNLKSNLTDKIGELEGDQAVFALRQLEKYLPDSGVDGITQGQLLKRMKKVNDELWSKVQMGQGFGSKNFNRMSIAQDVNDAFKSSGDPMITQLTEAMFDPLNKRNILRKGATKRVTGITSGGRETKVFSPDPMKAERAAPETLTALEKSGYKPEINSMVVNKNNVISSDLNEINDAIYILEAKKQQLGELPNRAELELNELVKKKQQLQDDIAIANNKDKSKLLEENNKTGRINKFDGDVPEFSPTELASDLVPNVAGRVLRRGVGAITSPVNQIRAYTAVREAFQTPALTAQIRALTLGGRSLTRAAIIEIAKQHKIEPDKLISVLKESGSLK
jgi:hypothetical protein